MGQYYNPRIPTDNLNFYWDSANLRSDRRESNTQNNMFDLVSTRDQFYSTGSGTAWNSEFRGYRTAASSTIYMQFTSFDGNQLSFCTWNQGAIGVSGYVFDAGNIHFQLPSQSVTAGVGVSVIFRADDGIDNRVFKTPSLSDIQGWTFWTGTKNATTGNMNLYRNGVLYASASSRTRSISSSSLTIFGRQNGQEVLSNSPVSMLAFYKKELTLQEIQQFYEATKGRYGL